MSVRDRERNGSGPGKPKKRRRKHSGLLLIALAVGAMVIVIGVRCAALQKTLTESQAKEAELTAELKTETDRTQQIEEYGKYTKTQKYIEEVAKDKLGLVHDDETIFKNEDSSK